jgi:hypothetical protein
VCDVSCVHEFALAFYLLAPTVALAFYLPVIPTSFAPVSIVPWQLHHNSAAWLVAPVRWVRGASMMAFHLAHTPTTSSSQGKMMLSFSPVVSVQVYTCFASFMHICLHKHCGYTSGGDRIVGV